MSSVSCSPVISPTFRVHEPADSFFKAGAVSGDRGQSPGNLELSDCGTAPLSESLPSALEHGCGLEQLHSVLAVVHAEMFALGVSDR
jgi:hypothetical protein